MADLTFSTFQERAAQTDRFVTAEVSQDDRATRGRRGLASAVFGLNEKAGVVAGIAKRLLRGDREITDLRDQERQDTIHALGDLLWYVSCVSGQLAVPLAEVAESNLRRAQSIYSRVVPEAQDQVPLALLDSDYLFLDSAYPAHEQLPRALEIEFEQVHRLGEERPRIVLRVVDGKAGQALGDALNDNNRYEDGYRFHDVFHLAFMAVLGWSPVMRALLGRKRQSKPQVDEVEDGGRARDIEEGLTAFIFQWAERHDFFDHGRERLPTELLTTVRAMVRHLEVRDRTENDWDKAIRAALGLFGQMKGQSRGRLSANMANRSLGFKPLPRSMATANPAPVAEEPSPRSEPESA